MAAPLKEGLDYFPLDVNIEQNSKIYYLESKHGPLAFNMIIKLWCRIYEKGYFLKWGEKEAQIFSRQTGIPLDKVFEIMDDCFEEGVFEKSLFENCQILTSKEIQRRFLSGCSRRKTIRIEKMYTLLDVNEYNNAVIVDTMSTLNLKMSTLTPQSKVKESKVEKSKVSKEEEEEITQEVKKKKAAASSETSSSDYSTELSEKFLRIVQSFPGWSVEPLVDRRWFVCEIERSGLYCNLRLSEELDGWETWLEQEYRKHRSRQRSRFPKNFKQSLRNRLKLALQFQEERNHGSGKGFKNQRYDVPEYLRG